MSFKFGPSRRGNGRARRGNMLRKRPSSPDPPPQEPYVGYSDKDFDDIYLTAGSKKAHHMMKQPMPVEEPIMHGYTKVPQMHDNYSPFPNNPAVDPIPTDYQRPSQHDFSKSIISLLRQDQFLDAAKEFERWCLGGQCNPSNFGYLLNLVSTANDILETLIESGHSLKEFINANKKEEDYRTLLLKEKCHAIESIFISCRVTKTRWPLSNFELDGVEDFCQKAFKGVDFLKDLLNPPKDNDVTTDQHEAPRMNTEYVADPSKPGASNFEVDSKGELLPSDAFDSSLCSILSIALNTYPNGATVSDLANYCDSNNVNVSKVGIERVLRKFSNLFIQRNVKIDKWTFHGFDFFKELERR